MGRKKLSSSLYSLALATVRGIFEDLESRRLLSTINVTSFGAIPNDGKDDLAAIRSAMNSSAAGDTIFFPTGTYNTSDKIMVKGNRTYDGESGATIKGDPSKHIFHIQQDNTKVLDLTFVGKPIKIDTPAGGLKVAGLLINNCVFNSATATGDGADGINFTTGLKNSTISNNTFNIGPHIALYGYYWDGLTISNNAFLNGVQGIHIDDLNDSSRNLLVEQNIFSGLSRMGIEYQGGGDNSQFYDNWYDKPVMTSNFADNNETFAYSIVADRSNGTIAKRNVIYAPERPDGTGVRIGFETGGDGTLVENNWVYGINQFLANTDRNGTTSVTVRNNYYDYLRNPNGGLGMTQINNGPQVDLDWIYERGKAGPNRRFVDASNPNGAIQTGSLSPTTPSSPALSTSTPAPAPTGDVQYLSDLNYSVAANGWGSVEENRSNGELGGADGKTITLNGKTYSKGLGVHADSTITYNLNGDYTRFFSDVGIDDEVGSRGSVVFQVWLDGVKAFDSDKMTGDTATKSINLDVTDKNTLKLVVNNAGDNNAYDHADWANVRLAGAGDWLSDLTWTSATNGWGAAERDRSNGEAGSSDGGTLSLRSNTYAKGLGVHANSEIRYDLNGGYETFTSDVGIDNETAGRGSVIFRVYLDGVLSYDSGTVRGADAVKQVSLDVTDVDELRLVVVGSDGGIAYDHADWAGAKLMA